MASTVFPAAAAGKTSYLVSLTSGSSYTVPAGVTYLNVTLYGGGGGGGGASGNFTSGNTLATVGGTTSFTGATSALGGTLGINMAAQQDTKVFGRDGSAGAANTGKGGKAAFVCMANQVSIGCDAADGQIVSSTLAVTPGASISYAIGAGGTGGFPNPGNTGGAGGSGRIDIEYWL